MSDLVDRYIKEHDLDKDEFYRQVIDEIRKENAREIRQSYIVFLVIIATIILLWVGSR